MIISNNKYSLEFSYGKLFDISNEIYGFLIYTSDTKSFTDNFIEHQHINIEFPCGRCYKGTLLTYNIFDLGGKYKIRIEMSLST